MCGLKIHRPRRGSMAFYPRKRASSIVAKFRTWVDLRIGKPIPLGFAAYKAGMAHVVMIDDRPTSPFYGKEVVKAVTILDAPPLRVLGFRAYTFDPWRVALLSIGEVWSSKIPEQVYRRVPTLPEKIDTDKMLEKVKNKLDITKEIRLIVSTQPWLSGIGKKTPEIFEIPIGGTENIEELFNYAVSMLGKELTVSNVFQEGQYVDVTAVTKGKGTEGVIKRFGVTILPKWHKHRKGHRRTGTISPQKPAVMYTVPRQGQLGFQKRTEYNKRILMIGTNGQEVTPPEGFKHYGVITGQYIILEGSVPGPRKRLVMMRFPVRPRPPTWPTTKPQIVWISTKPIT
ncbi:MAG: 50S ribosomal protein L3 [Thermoprotei archaeon ex4572_64]|nr:MAG: 50S ribosomal protein L3 [Thermoprotei archaeon ex4572_64]